MQLSQIAYHLPGQLVAPRRILDEALAHDAQQLGRRVGVDLGQRPRFGAGDGVEGINHRLAAEGPLAADHFIQHAAESEQVGPLVDRLFTLNLLGRHVPRRAHHLSRYGTE